MVRDTFRSAENDLDFIINAARESYMSRIGRGLAKEIADNPNDEEIMTFYVEYIGESLRRFDNITEHMLTNPEAVGAWIQPPDSEGGNTTREEEREGVRQRGEE